MRSEFLFICGLGRCGTSLVMQMLDAAGLRCPGNHPAFESSQWALYDYTLDLSQYDAVKWLDPQIASGSDLPELPRHRAIFLTRDHREQAKSHHKFMAWSAGETSSRKQRRATEASLRRDEPRALRLVRSRANGVLVMTFEALLSDPRKHAETLSAFCGGLDAGSMAAVVYNRPVRCLDVMLEEIVAKGQTR